MNGIEILRFAQNDVYNKAMTKKLIIGGQEIKLGERKRVDIDLGQLYDLNTVGLAVEVIRGKKPGPTLFISAVMHGDEINGVEICRRLLAEKCLKNIKGTLIVIPVINIFGFYRKTRYLPDGRDLNRCFPGSDSGSLGSRMAKIIMDEIVSQSTHGIDLHTAGAHRSNLPQIRASLDDAETARLAKSFEVPVILNSRIREGSLREAISKSKHPIPLLIFEGGRALRFNEETSRVGLRGILSTMNNLGMIATKDLPFQKAKKSKALIAKSSYWLRAAQGGIFVTQKKLGADIKTNERIGYITDVFNTKRIDIIAPQAGIMIGLAIMPLVNQGDAMVHIATFQELGKVAKSIEKLGEEIDQFTTT